LKRTFPQKVKPVPSCETDTGMNIDQSKMLSESNCRTRTSAAVIGLAFSMGAQGILLPQVSEAAPAAADAIAAESVAAVLPSAFNVAASSTVHVSNSLASEPRVAIIAHTVQEGQTLSRIAQLYRVATADILATNALTADTVIRVGQVLRIPVDARIAQLVESNRGLTDTPVYYGLVQNTPAQNAATVAPDTQISSSDTGSADHLLKAKQDTALSNLQQKRETLRRGLGQLSAPSSVVETVPEPSVVASSPAPASSSLWVASGEKSVKSNVTAVLTPDIGTAAVSAPASLTHRVSVGDTLNSIARSHGVSARQLVEANRISDPNSIFVDQVLTIPQSQAFTPTTPVMSPVLGASKFGVAPTLPSKTAAADSTSSNTVGFQPGVAVSPAAVDSSSLTVPTTAAVGSSTASEAAPARSRHDYVENLRAEIIQLRDRYKAAGSTVVRSEPSLRAADRDNSYSANARSESVRNPEFVSSGYSESLRAQVRRLNSSSQNPQAAKSVAEPASAVSSAKPTVVAMAPVGSQNYDPLIGKSIGRMVSPELPPLGSGDAYLPSGSGKFAGYIWPAKGLLTSLYGPRWGRMHRGIDVAAPTGTPIVAAAPGVVITAGWNSGGYGNLVEVQHPDGSVTLYGHNERVLVKEGQQVAQGQQIAEMGSTGYSTGPHCHFEVHMPGKGAVNPMAHLPNQGA
jgi:murein DD-endopeptidase MepM/ murein hydrolase activator NlpD